MLFKRPSQVPKKIRRANADEFWTNLPAKSVDSHPNLGKPTFHHPGADGVSAPHRHGEGDNGHCRRVGNGRLVEHPGHVGGRSAGEWNSRKDHIDRLKKDERRYYEEDGPEPEQGRSGLRKRIRRRCSSHMLLRIWRRCLSHICFFTKGEVRSSARR